MWVSTKGTVKQCVVVLQHLQQVCVLVEAEMCETVHDIADICPLVLCIKNLGDIRAQPIFAKEFILCLDEEHVFHAVKVCGVQTIRWEKQDGTIKPFDFFF